MSFANGWHFIERPGCWRWNGLRTAEHWSGSGLLFIMAAFLYDLWQGNSFSFLIWTMGIKALAVPLFNLPEAFWAIFLISISFSLITLFWFVSNLTPPKLWDLNYTGGKINKTGIINRCYPLHSYGFQPKAWQSLRLLLGVNKIIIYKSIWGINSRVRNDHTNHLHGCLLTEPWHLIISQILIY